jgi:hypothetical protein
MNCDKENQNSRLPIGSVSHSYADCIDWELKSKER